MDLRLASHRRAWTAAGIGGTTIALATSLVVSTTGVAEACEGHNNNNHNNHNNNVAATPYLGWSSWSLQAAHDTTLNPQGNYSWLTEENVLAQVDVMASTLKEYGYEYINIDAGWWMDWDWNQQYDANGIQTPDAERFPNGIKYVADYIHSKGLKVGIYLPVGLEKGAYDNGDFPIAGTTDCSTHDIVYDDLRTTNGWDSSYKIDFSTQCAQAYVDSQINQLASWGIDFLKVDGVGPGSWRSGENYDNTADIMAFHEAIENSGRDMILELSWSLDHDYIETWQEYADGWRIDGDIECWTCTTLTNWDTVKTRFTDVVEWIDDAGSDVGWNDLDSLNVGVGSMDGLTDDERRSTMTLWAIEASPLYSGDDLTQLDEFGLSLLTNRDVLAINQAGNPARPVSTDTDQQVWYAENSDGSYTVALFNLSDAAADVTAIWSDLGISGSVTLNDVWESTSLGKSRGSYTTTLNAHATQLLRVTPRQR